MELYETLPIVPLRDVVVFPRGDQHVMRSHPAASTTPLTTVFTPGKHDEPPQLSFGGGGRTSRFVCGYLNCDQRFSPIVEALPTMLVVRSRDDYSAIDAIDAGGQRPTTVPHTVPGSAYSMLSS